MHRYRTRLALRLLGGMTFFLHLDIGLTRGEAPRPPEKRIARLEEELSQARKQLSATEETLAIVRSRLRQRRKQLRAKDRRIEHLETRLNEPESIAFGNLVLPPPSLRPHRPAWRRNDAEYVEAARREVDWMVENLGLSTESSVLDVGCGPGRIAIGILDRLGEVREYRGVDVDERSIEWAQAFITPGHPSFRFHHLDVENARYNPEGKTRAPGVRLPFPEEEFDVVCLFSVFTHMLADDVRAYLLELRRVLSPGGRIVLTANLEDDVPDVEENPIGYRGRTHYSGPLESVRYDRKFFEGLVRESGFEIERYDPTLRKQQRTLILTKARGHG